MNKETAYRKTLEVQASKPLTVQLLKLIEEASERGEFGVELYFNTKEQIEQAYNSFEYLRSLGYEVKPNVIMYSFTDSVCSIFWKK